MTLIEYFNIIENFRKWVIDNKYMFLKTYEELVEKNLRNEFDVKPLLSLFMRTDNRIKDFINQLRAIEQLLSYLEVQNNVNLAIQKLSDSYPYEAGRNGLIFVFEELIKDVQPIECEFLEKTSLLAEQEKVRLQEAFHNLHENCYFSSTVNAVVALEFRLFKILRTQNEEFLLEKNEELRFTLGMLVSLYSSNKSKFDNVVPDKFDYLLRLCNSYRIFSAHAKEEKINANDARAILSLVFSFLLDERCEVRNPI